MLLSEIHNCPEIENVNHKELFCKTVRSDDPRISELFINTGMGIHQYIDELFEANFNNCVKIVNFMIDNEMLPIHGSLKIYVNICIYIYF